ncbi:uncharacterized protein LODBEIA_P27480 [Lodderomyces beijingensis]|uniref:C2H2-type domain-containing protein n=1 Tax=Lodderomyces beijingensis TaxID=1775926 RepID=A0ABP0ZKV9_9ASCO
MTSLAILPQLKRTMTDIVDEELYHIPSSPIMNFSNNNNIGNINDNFSLNLNTTSAASSNGHYQNQRSYSHHSNRNSVSSSPILSYTQMNTQINTNNHGLYNSSNNNNSSNNLGNVLNIPDSFVEQLKSQEYIEGLRSYHHQQQQSQSQSQSQQQQQQQSINDYPDYQIISSQPTFINPFTNYGNPNTFVRLSQYTQQQQQQQAQQLPQQPQQQQPQQQSQPHQPQPQQAFPQVQPQVSPLPLPQAFPTRRRRRITTLDEDEPNSGSKKKSLDEEYLLYNPDISPGHIIRQTDLDSSYYVPPNTVNTGDIMNLNLNSNLQAPQVDNVIPGYEGDYLYLDDDQEEIEEDLSDDEDDNYFHVDEAFDDYVMSNSGYYSNNNGSVEDYTTFDDFKNIRLDDNHEETSFPDALKDLRDEATNNCGHNEQQQQQQQQQPPPQQHQQEVAGEVSPASIVSRLSSIPSLSRHTSESSHEEEVGQATTIKQEPLDDDAMAVDEVDDDANVVVVDEEDESTLISTSTSNSTIELKEKHIYKLGAEISANNPDHRCDLINPTTGQMCNKQFSRPYDLIRHQNTIHASLKKIFRCVICEGRYQGGTGNGKEKTFSRGDALSRHIKIKHGLVGEEAIQLINEAKENVEYHPVQYKSRESG